MLLVMNTVDPQKHKKEKACSHSRGWGVCVCVCVCVCVRERERERDFIFLVPAMHAVLRSSNMIEMSKGQEHYWLGRGSKPHPPSTGLLKAAVIAPPPCQEA